MGRAAANKKVRKEARKAMETFIDAEADALARRIMKERPTYMPRFLWRAIAKINIKVPIDS